MRLRTDVEYPIEWEGQSVCAIYDYVAADGRRYVKNEGYHFDKMNAALASDDELRGYLAARGLNAVNGCDDARTFTKLKYELLESKPSTYVLEASPDDETADGETKRPETLSGERELLVMDSQTFGNPATVELRIWSGSTLIRCSGFMISDTAVLTAAHCIPSNGSRPITIEAANGTCAYPSSWSNCGLKPSNTAYGYRHADYTGAGDAGDDIGLIALSYEPGAPLNDPIARLRIAVSNTSAGHDVWLVGYGANAMNGTGIGTQRISNSDAEVDWAGTKHFYWTIESGEGRSCKVDSGGPSIATELALHDVSMGITSEFTNPIPYSNACGPTSYQDRKTMMSKKISWIEDKIGECDTFTGEGWFEYKKCWE